MRDEVRVFAPATVANVACGYDVLGLAIHSPGDEVVVRPSSSPGLKITKITGDGGKLPTEASKNTAGVAALALLESLGQLDLGIEMEIHKKMPFGSGLGSSAASAVAGVFAVNSLLGSPLTRRQLLPFAMAGEVYADGAYHADNIGPCLLGGILLIRSNPELDVCPLPTPDDLYVAVVHPDVEILTKDARAALPKEVPMATTTQQMGNLAGFICGLYNQDYPLISRSLNDGLAEPHRKSLIPGFDEAKSAAEKHGALGFSISGAGPSVFALCQGKDKAQTIGQAIADSFGKLSISHQLHVSPVNQTGVQEI